MSRKPAALQYGVDDIPPASVICMNALQYVAVLSGFLVFPLLMAREGHLPATIADSVLSWSFIVLAIGTTLQALPRGPVGSGLLTPTTLTAVYVSPTLAAIQLGGLPMVAGMTMFGGLAEAAISRSMQRLRSLMPLCSLNAPVRRVIDLSGFSSVLQTYASRDEAVAKLAA